MKKIFLMIITLMLFNITIVKAETITLNNIKDKFNEVSFTINSEVQDNNLIIKNSNYDITLKYENNILESEKTYDDILNSAKDLTVYSYIVKAVALLKGYSYKDIDYFLPKINEASLNKNGYALDRKNNTITFKLNIEDFHFDLNYINAEKPKIDLSKINENTVKINIMSNDNNIDLYRSKDNKNYEYLATIEMKDGIGSYLDLRLNKDNYYYKAVVAKSDNFSDIQQINLSFGKEDDNYLDETTTNPLTGHQEFIAVSMLVIILIIEIISNISFRKKVYK